MTYSEDRRPPPPVTLFLLLLVAILVFLALYGCKCPPQIASSDTVRQTITRIVPHDTTVYVTDSAGMLAALECDSLGKIRIKEIQDYYSGMYVKSKIKIQNNILSVNSKIDSAAIVIRWNETHTVTTSNTHTVTVPPAVNYVTGFQWFQIWLARILLIAGVIYGLCYAVKNSTWWVKLISIGSKLIGKLISKKSD